MKEIIDLVEVVIKDSLGLDIEVVFDRPDSQFGDLTTNVAMQAAKQLNKNPREIAQNLAEKILKSLPEQIVDASVAGPGFINLTLADDALKSLISAEPLKPLDGQTIVAEYSDPNPFKVLHAGHLYTTLVGDSISRLLEAGGGNIHRVNFGGDVGLHVAKNMWAIIQYLSGENSTKLDEVGLDPHERAAWLSARYVEGNEAYETDEVAKAEIVAMNKKVYQIHENNDHESPLAQIYWTCRQWSYDYFQVLYDELEVEPFEKYYPESATADIGLNTVKEQLEKGVYTESDGAVIFAGEDYGLHTRVFINKQGLPTYEAKDVGLIMCKWRDYQFDQSVIITGNDIVEYMKVVLKSIEQYMPELASRTRHLTHGNIKLAGGTKMSSRKGNVLLALDVLESARTAASEYQGSEDEDVVLGAVKYAFLRNKIGSDIIYDPKDSVSLQGNSGPYLMYAHARARSIIAKATKKGSLASDIQSGERQLVVKLGQFSEILNRAIINLEPHHICNYLYELAQEFNRFYENNRVIGDDREEFRLALVEAYADKLKRGLVLLGIKAPEKM